MKLCKQITDAAQSFVEGAGWQPMHHLFFFGIPSN
jgi:hypothetical protein